MGGARDGRPRPLRIFGMALGELIAATIFIRSRQQGHARTSVAILFSWVRPMCYSGRAGLAAVSRSLPVESAHLICMMA